MVNNSTYDHKKLISHYGLEDVDRAFFNWWDKKLNLHLLDNNNQKKKIPVLIFTAERWQKAREVGVRDKNGTLIVPLIIVSRVATNDASEGTTARIFADYRDYHIVAKQADRKSSLIKNLIENRAYNIDPDLPIHEIYAVPVPDHFSLIYKVAIWTSYMEDMNEVMEKIGQEFNYKSKKMFKFDMENGMWFTAFKDDEISDESNLDDFSESERIIRKEYTFSVSAHILPESNERKDPFRRYFSQSKLAIKQEVVVTSEDIEKYFGKK